MTNKKSNKKFFKRMSRYLLFKKLKPQQELNEYQPHVYNKKSLKSLTKRKYQINLILFSHLFIQKL